MNTKTWFHRARRALIPAAVLWAVATDFHGDPSQYFTYFTVLTNLGIAAWFLSAAAAPPRAERSSGVRLLLTICGLITLSVYWILLSPTHHPQGALFWATIVLHLIVPVAMALEDLIVPWPPTRLAVPALCLLPPLGYWAFAVVRGEFWGWYPYFFLDRHQVGGWVLLLVFLVALLGIFAVLAFAWRLLVHRRQRKKTTAE